MQVYANLITEKAIEEKEDPISAEILDTTHPRAVMMLRRSNNIPYPYNTVSLYSLLTVGDATDPFTRIPFDNLTRQRILLYKQCLTQFPNYVLNVKDLYERWIKNRDDPVLCMEAKCFLQAEDLVELFQNFSGKGSMRNREDSENFLEKTGQTWILRASSLVDTEYNKGYTLTQKVDDVYIHASVIHLIGKGFYYRAKLERGQVIPNFFSFVESYPTIIDLLLARVKKF